MLSVTGYSLVNPLFSSELREWLLPEFRYCLAAQYVFSERGE